jgi:non-specific serine/threonine protein kinase
LDGATLGPKAATASELKAQLEADAQRRARATIVKRHLIALGGEDPTKVVAAVQSFDLGTSRWSVLPPMRTPRHGMAVVSVGNTLYALDGAEAPTHAESTNQAEALDFL